MLWCSVVLRAEISFSYEDFRRVVRGVRGEALKQQRPSPAETLMNLWFRLRRAVLIESRVGLFRAAFYWIRQAPAADFFLPCFTCANVSIHALA